MSHTPGPWSVGGRCGNYKTDVVACDASPLPKPTKGIASVFTHVDDPQYDAKHGEVVPDAEGHANLRLIAAAPELAEALLDLCQWFDYHGSDFTAENGLIYKRARAALAKAEGR